MANNTNTRASLRAHAAIHSSSSVRRLSALALTALVFGGACSDDKEHAANEPRDGGAGAHHGGAERDASPGRPPRDGESGAGGAPGVDASGADGKADANPDEPDASRPLLPGDPAIRMFTDVAPTATSDADIVDGLILNKLDVWFTATATVAQASAAIESIGGKIASMSRGSLAVTVTFPRVTDLAALQEKKAALESAPGVLAVLLGEPGALQSLPPAPADSAENIGHLFPSNFPAAWNASALATKGCEGRKVPVRIADFFTSSPPAAFKKEVPDFTVTSGTSNGYSTHGYIVTALAAARFDANPATGANPFSQCLDLQGIQLGTFSLLERVRIIAGELPAGKAIVNGSYGYSPPTCKAAACTPEDFKGKAPLFLEHLLLAIEWRRLTSKADTSTLFVTAAGNDRDSDAGVRYALFRNSRVASDMALGSSALVFGTPRLKVFDDAAFFEPDPAYAGYPSMALDRNFATVLRVSLDLQLGTGVGPAENVLIVGSMDGDPNASSAEASFSDFDPDVHVVGTEIALVDGRLHGSGTSYSAPQVAALASYLWLLSDELRNQPAAITRRTIIENSVVPRYAPQVRLVDAYASALALDKTTGAPSRASMPVRFALLDITEDGVFDEADIQQFAPKLVDELLEPRVQTWGRMDLNGDGYEGGRSHIARFDLDPTGSTQFGGSVYTSVPVTVTGQQLSYSELSVFDFTVLCYYAYSPLYTGDAKVRDDRIARICGAALPRPANCPNNGIPEGSNCYTPGFNCCPGFTCKRSEYCAVNDISGPGCSECGTP